MIEIILKSSYNYDKCTKLQRICLYDMKQMFVSAELSITDRTDQHTRLGGLARLRIRTWTQATTEATRCEYAQKLRFLKSRGRTTVKSSLADTSLSAVIVFPCSRYAGKSLHCLTRTGFPPIERPFLASSASNQRSDANRLASLAC